jgi:hypothetical protein
LSGDGNSCPKLATLSALQVAEKWMKIEKQVKIPTWKTAGVRYSRKLKTQLKSLNLEGRWNAFTLISRGRLIWKFKWNEWILWKLTRIMIYQRSSDLEVNDLPNTSSCQGGGTLVQDQTEWNGVAVTIFVVLISQNCLFVSDGVSSVKTGYLRWRRGNPGTGETTKSIVTTGKKKSKIDLLVANSLPYWTIDYDAFVFALLSLALLLRLRVASAGDSQRCSRILVWRRIDEALTPLNLSSDSAEHIRERNKCIVIDGPIW